MLNFLLTMLPLRWSVTVWAERHQAEMLLSEDNLTVAEVSYKVGISDPFYFSKCFKAQFGVAPSVYQRGVNNEGINEKNE